MKKSPKVVYLKSKLPSQKKLKRNASHYTTGKMNGPPASKTEMPEPESIRGAWLGLRHFGYRVDFDDPSGLKVNGKPIHMDPLMKLTNRIRRENFLPPVGKKKEWLE